MDFRSNEADRTDLEVRHGGWPRCSPGRSPIPVEATKRGRRSFVAIMKIESLSVDFTDEQKRYLEGFTTGLQISRVGRGFAGAAMGKSNAEPTGPEAQHIKAQD